jgi:hypothetical protein
MRIFPERRAKSAPALGDGGPVAAALLAEGLATDEISDRAAPYEVLALWPLSPTATEAHCENMS